MRLASLFSGGKDSTFAVYRAQRQGHDIACLLSALARSDESHLLHHPNMEWTRLQSEAMGIPQMTILPGSDRTDDELSSLEDLLQGAKDRFGIEGVVHGGIASRFQKKRFESLCSGLDLETVSPLWGTDPKQYMRDLLDAGFEFVVTSVSSGGLDGSWLGRTISRDDIGDLARLSERFGFNLNFEGGEAETFVVNCPLFSRPIHIKKSSRAWDGYRGRFEIVDAGLDYDA